MTTITKKRRIKGGKIMKHRYWILFCVILISLGTFGCGDDITKKYLSSCCEEVGALDEPTGDEGNFVLSMAGGEGTDGYGGSGGYLSLWSYSNTGIYKKTRSLDTDFTVPIPIQAEYLGDTGATISVNTTIPVDPIVKPAAGDLFMLSTDRYLYRALSEGSEVVTGLKVNAGVTLTLELNYDWNGSGYGGSAALTFEDDVVIAGTLATDNLLGSGELRHDSPALASDKGSLWLDIGGRFIMAEGSLIDTAGDDAAEDDTRGGDGGRIDITTENGNGLLLQGTVDASGGDGLGTGIGGDGAVASNTSIDQVYFDSDDEAEPGTLINTGTIDASGGDGASGGDAGGIELDSEWMVYNTGDLYSNGGLGRTGSGGDGYQIYLEPDGGSLFNSGDLHVEGGDGATGGDSGNLYLYSADENMGDLINTGDIYVHGGDATGENGDGGDGADYIYFYNYGGKIVTTGDIFGDGGDGAGNGYGGDAVEYLYVYVYEGSDFGFGEYASPGLIQITGNISLDGGSGYWGGDGCDYFYVDNSDYSYYNFPPVYPMEFLGYTTVDLTGGKGETNGGDGGDLYIYTNVAWYGYDYNAYPTGAIANRADILAAGGEGGIYTGTMPMQNGYGGFGGEGGTIDFETYDYEYPAYFGTTVLLNSGDLDVSGGKGTDGGNSGDVYLYGHDYVENTGTIRVMGGEAAGSGGNGGIGAFGGESGIEIYATFDIMNSGDIIATGGAGTGNAADGGDCYELDMIAGRQVTNSGDIYMNGGYGDYGGHGGLAVIGSETTATDNSGMITVAGGVGSDDSDGDDGAIWIDGFVLTSGDETDNDG
jgi:hypothetical protein